MTIEQIEHYSYIKNIVEQLEKCNFKDEVGNPLENNIAFIVLKTMQKCEWNMCNRDTNHAICECCYETK